MLEQIPARRIEWDAKHARITNHPELNAFIKEPVRDGWGYGDALGEGIG